MKCMIARFLPSAYFTLHTSRNEHLSRTSVQQKMVNTDACIAGVRISEIVQECVNRPLGYSFLMASVQPCARSFRLAARDSGKKSASFTQRPAYRRLVQWRGRFGKNGLTTI